MSKAFSAMKKMALLLNMSTMLLSEQVRYVLQSYTSISGDLKIQLEVHYLKSFISYCNFYLHPSVKKPGTFVGVMDSVGGVQNR